MPRLYPVVLSGGTGTRLWPVSRALLPKPLLPLVSKRSMLQETVERVTGEAFAAPMIVCNEMHRFIIAEQMRAMGVRPQAIVLEPEGRNTGPAATIAALALARVDAEAVMLLLPSDHVVADVSRFRAAVATALAAASKGALVTFGITPHHAETGYGYIRLGEPLAGVPECWRIDHFVEKPDRATAEAYLASGNYAWNSGMFVLPVQAFLNEVERLEPAMLAGCREALGKAEVDADFVRLATEPFLAARSISIDYAVMEHTREGAVVAADIGWNDVGSWSSLWDITQKDACGNVQQGDAITMDVRNCYIRSHGKLIAAIGVEDLVIVATDDVVLVVPRARAQDVKKLVETVEKAGRTEHFVHTQVFRPWGWFRRIRNGERYQVKEILVEPGRELSLQMHHHRAEHWVVVSGTARVQRENEVIYVTENQSTYIPHATRHRLGNPGKIPLRMIEVQSGPYLGEDDIVRFEDTYGRSGG